MEAGDWIAVLGIAVPLLAAGMIGLARMVYRAQTKADAACEDVATEKVERVRDVERLDRRVDAFSQVAASIATVSADVRALSGRVDLSTSHTTEQLRDLKHEVRNVKQNQAAITRSMIRKVEP